MPVITPDSNPKFQAAFDAVQEILTTFGNKPPEEILPVMVTSFGESFDIGALLGLAAELQSGQLTSIPTVESVSAESLQGAIAAYEPSLDTIYLSEDYLTETSIENLTSTLLQHFGYGIDHLVNVADAPGDEGAIFADLVQGITLGVRELATLKSLDNSRSLTINEQVLDVEISEDLSNGVDPADESNPVGTINPFKGGKGRDRFKGDDSDNEMSGGVGKDRLAGAGGNDKMDGGGGKDVLKGGDGEDELLGGGGNDKMNGGNDDDFLTGGSGRDKMKGGKGSDSFIYEKMGDRGDIIVDFDPTADVLDFSELFSDMGVGSNVNQLLNDVIVLGSAKRGTLISIDKDGVDGNGKAQKLLFLRKVDATELSARNFDL